MCIAICICWFLECVQKNSGWILMNFCVKLSLFHHVWRSVFWHLKPQTIIHTQNEISVRTKWARDTHLSRVFYTSFFSPLSSSLFWKKGTIFVYSQLQRAARGCLLEHCSFPLFSSISYSLFCEYFSWYHKLSFYEIMRVLFAFLYITWITP